MGMWPSATEPSSPVATASIETGFEGFGSSEASSLRTLDELTRLASRPPAGITGFDAGQTPAWLGGWTGGM